MRGAAAQLGHDARDRGEDVAQSRAGDLGDEDIAGRDAAELALAADHAGASCGAADAGGLASQDAIGVPRLGDGDRGLDAQRPRLDELEAVRPQDPLDLDRMGKQLLGAKEKGSESRSLRPIETRAASAREGSLMRTTRCRLRSPRLGFEHDGVAIEEISIGHHLALRNRGARSRRGREQHLAARRAAEASTRRSRGDERLHEQGHRVLRRIDLLQREIAKRPHRPERRPAGAHGGQVVRLAPDAEIALELPCEARSGAIFYQRRGAHRRGDALERLPGLENGHRDRLLEETHPHFQRAAPRERQIGRGRFVRRDAQTEVLDLCAIGLRVDAGPARRRQPRLREPGEIGGLGPESLRVGRLGRLERDGERHRTWSP